MEGELTIRVVDSWTESGKVELRGELTESATGKVRETLGPVALFVGDSLSVDITLEDGVPGQIVSHIVSMCESCGMVEIKPELVEAETGAVRDQLEAFKLVAGYGLVVGVELTDSPGEEQGSCL